jgi:hypothetical protein
LEGLKTTGISYTRKQFKSKWEKLKIDYGIWKKLTKQTGLGWDENQKNIDMPEEWWSRMSKVSSFHLLCKHYYVTDYLWSSSLGHFSKLRV